METDDLIKLVNFSQKEKEILSGKGRIAYQIEEKEYHARSFEDAFIHLNREFVRTNKEKFTSLKNRKYFDEKDKNQKYVKDAYDLAEHCIDSKTGFALDILYFSNENFSNWQTPAYIVEALLWLRT